MRVPRSAWRACPPKCRSRSKRFSIFADWTLTNAVIHFNHSGAGLPSAEIVRAITDHLRRAAERGPMEAGGLAAKAIDKTYEAAARLLGCSPQDVAFGTSHGQLYGDIVSAIPLSAKDRILVSRQEWIGNVLCLQRSADLSGASLSLMASDRTSAVDVVALGESLSPDVRIVALTWIGAGSALINPAAAIGKAIRRSGSSAFYHRCEPGGGQVAIDVSDIGCDALVACGRKFLRGPRGTALAYMSPRLAAEIVPRSIDNLSSALVDGAVVVSKSARAFEVGEESVALKLGLGKAIEQALELGVDHIRSVLDHKASILRQALAEVPGVRILDLGDNKGAAVTFVVEGRARAAVKRSLADQGINIGMNGSQYTPYDMDIRGISDLLRASVHLSTTVEHITTIVDAVKSIARSQSVTVPS